MTTTKHTTGARSAQSLIAWWLPALFTLALLFGGNVSVFAQDDAPADTTQTDTTQAPATEEAAVEAEPEETTLKSRMSLTADQHPDGAINLKALLRAKVDGSYQKVPERKVLFFVLDASGEEVALGDTVTGLDGTGALRVNKAGLFRSEDGFYSFLARYDGDDKIEGSESDLMLKPATLEMKLSEADSTYLVTLTASADSPDGPMPIAGAVVAVYVKRMFSSLKVAEGETDETGAVELEFPNGLAGDDQGNLQITAMIEETEEYGNLTASADQKWGYAVSAELKETPKALWSPHPPTWMVITFFILMGAVWIHFVIVVYNLFRIKSIGHQASGKA